MKRRYDILIEWVKKYQWRCGAELGVFKGDTFLRLLAKCPNLILIGVDIWIPQPEQDADRMNGGRSYKQYDLTAFERNVRFRANDFGKRAVIIKKTTVDAANDIEDGSLDFVFIDADHTAAGVRRDILAWRSKIRKGGVLSGHDYNQRDFPGVVQVIDDLYPSRKLHDDHVWAVKV